MGPTEPAKGAEPWTCNHGNTFGAVRPADHVVRAREFVKRHPEVSITFPRQNGTDEHIASWISPAATPDDEGIVEKASHYLLEQLVDYLEARFDRGDLREPGSAG